MNSSVIFQINEYSFIKRCLSKVISTKIILAIIFWTFIILGKQVFFSNLLYIFIVVYLFFVFIVIYESRVLITKITLDDDSICFKYNKFYKNMELTISRDTFTYKIRNTTNITLISDRIFFYNEDKCTLIQYSSVKYWTLDEINKVSMLLKDNGIKKVFGENM